MNENFCNKNNITLQIEESLIEQNYGIYEGVVRKNKNFLANKRNLHTDILMENL